MLARSGRKHFQGRANTPCPMCPVGPRPRPVGRAGNFFDNHASREKKPTWAGWAGLVIDRLELDRPEFEPGRG